MSETEWRPEGFASQTADGHLFLADEMAFKYGIDARAFGWARDAELSGWRSPYINPWTEIRAFEDRTISVVTTPSIPIQAETKL